MSSLDNIQLRAEGGDLLFLKICLAFILFSLAIDIKKEDFKTLFINPKSVLIGCFSQMVLLPLLTFILIKIMHPPASIAMGMLLVAACPCGNMSTYISYLANGFVPLSISITAISTISASVTTPFNFYFYASNYEPANALLHEIHISFSYLLLTILLLLMLPLAIGMISRAKFPNLTARITKPVKIIALLLFLLFMIGAFIKNYTVFMENIHQIFWYVFIQNALAFLVGYCFPRILKINKTHSRSISIETGIHNSGLGLILVLTFFNGNGGMALIAAWWGVWHIIAGLALALFWRKFTATAVTSEEQSLVL
ncbi:MAG TPA: bile acid:sodium symporter family protein [Chitinophagales bacterium]|nr:bile acid:sodium symporter family protein [Chitinophagales bacterium]HNM31240.1 bile acid:sodium symporter family protein [Chitinophagales bacterium]